MTQEQPDKDVLAIVQVCNYCSARQASRYTTQLYDHCLQVVSLTMSQFTILAWLSQYPGITMKELATRLVMDRTTLLRAVKPLERDGLVMQVPASKARSRLLALFLTEQGKHKYREAYPHWSAAQEKFEKQVGIEHAQLLHDEQLRITEL